ncbi:DUF7260 family protein [Natronomonas amylolytica]|uniref:DUF7260 family protein n=1 Tax=Natronomonas amylolytica TaxID=3108498 RepID=UPI003AB84224
MKDNVKRLQQAIESLEEERSLARQECRAWKSFLKAVRLSTTSTAQATAGAESERNRTRVETLRRRYEETVMDTPNYDKEYGETIDESLQAEFGTNLAEKLSSGGGLRPLTRRNLLVTTGDRVEQNRRYAATLDDECEHLREAKERIQAIESQLTSVRPPTDSGMPIEQRIEAWSTLEELEERCQQLLVDRQQFIDKQLRPSIDSDIDVFTEYLYEETGSRHPILWVVAAIAKKIETLRTGNHLQSDSLP